ncbi:Cof-type HAD-IIB family hydrolase [Pediococcus ethanolidurans]|uniref:Cof-type HAD-IIB family hydrolase n=1 Tax=Pediococcus ethanolidurans TaxID=319653 RepID=UPI0021AAA929|nr:Cof-type HAD-IIB family hydrolase [Pediococcus ethanolidurans]MCT4398866.1 HAD family phosphatase [Pediococcus ethanolidurans]MCV3323049.1 Cof-type HAD-IIB family hydrolase [Pediococcus ethanolidurans]MCV3554610.1 Cof-type HAD-IIB family hydrolase [Pediococcus ethanolidurans]
MPQKLITIDLDGTTLNSQNQISSKTIEVIQKATEAGHLVSIVTGRPYRISEAIYDQLQLKTPMVNFNGALTHIPHQHWQGEYKRTISKAIVLDMLENRQKLQFKMIAAEGKHTYLANHLPPSDLNFFPTTLSDDQLLSKTSLVHNPTSMILFVAPHQEQIVRNTVLHHYGQQVDVGVWGGPNSVLEVVSKGIQKAKAVAYIAKQYHIDRQNIVAFGDEHNDAEMLDYAGRGVAMQNATPIIKSIANDVTEFDNDHDGLAKYLETYLKLAN